jgi:hypothetical protein
MRRLMTRAAVVIGALGMAAHAGAAQAPEKAAAARASGATFSCTATAGITKADTARLTGDVQRTGGYAIKVSAAGGEVVVTVDPQSPRRSGAVTRVAAPIDGVLLRSPYKSEAIAQPVHLDREPVQWPDAPAGAAGANRARATFDLKGVQAMPAGDVLVVVTTADGERVCTMKAKNRRRLAGS